MPCSRIPKTVKTSHSWPPISTTQSSIAPNGSRTSAPTPQATNCDLHLDEFESCPEGPILTPHCSWVEELVVKLPIECSAVICHSRAVHLGLFNEIRRCYHGSDFKKWLFLTAVCNHSHMISFENEFGYWPLHWVPWKRFPITWIGYVPSSLIQLPKWSQARSHISNNELTSRGSLGPYVEAKPLLHVGLEHIGLQVSLHASPVNLTVPELMSNRACCISLVTALVRNSHLNQNPKLPIPHHVRLEELENHPGSLQVKPRLHAAEKQEKLEVKVRGKFV